MRKTDKDKIDKLKKELDDTNYNFYFAGVLFFLAFLGLIIISVLHSDDIDIDYIGEHICMSNNLSYERTDLSDYTYNNISQIRIYCWNDTTHQIRGTPFRVMLR